MENKKIIFVVDDEQTIRELYKCALDNAGMDCYCFPGSKEFFNEIDKKIPDLIILDIMLEGLSGYDILQQLKLNKKYENIPVIMVSAKGEELSKVKGLDMGANDYISKPFGILELIARIKANLRKTENFKKSGYKDIKVNYLTYKIAVNEKELSLTLKQFNLFVFLINNAEKVVTRDEIFNNVWGEEYFGETRTLDIHITELRKILNLNKSKAQIETVRGVGYILK